ncbi:peptide deformylase [Candidatus Parcubacteria bacterium]|nr:peptide deformylase [Candidatus Parcubacteria bacterium]
MAYAQYYHTLDKTYDFQYTFSVEITKIPDKILASKVAQAPEEAVKNGEFLELIEEMRTAMKDNAGVGLAANQIGKDLAIFVIDKKLADEHQVPDAYINPEITEYSKDEDFMEEGCLSIPGFYTEIKRSKKVKLKALDENGKKIKIKAKGFLARVLQHETDHLCGIVIKDKQLK